MELDIGGNIGHVFIVGYTDGVGYYGNICRWSWILMVILVMYLLL